MRHACLFFFLVKQQVDEECPKGSFTNPKNKRCYKFYKNKLAWQEAYQYCLNEGGNLAVFDDKTTMKFLKKK